MGIEEDEPYRAAARAAYEASCAIHGRQTDEREFRTQFAEWLAIAKAVKGAVHPLPGTASRYARNVLETGGLPGMEREARRLLHKMRTAASLYRDGRVKAILHPTDDVAARVDAAVAKADAAALAVDLDLMQSRIVEAQKLADPGGRAALVLHTDEREWERYDSYAAYRDSFEPRN